MCHLWSSCLPQCEHRELFIRHIRGLSLDVQSELAVVIQEVLMQSRSDSLGVFFFFYRFF